MTVTLRVEDLASEFFEALRGLIYVAGELASKHIYLDPRDPAGPESARSYCALCLRYGLNFQAIDHAPSCLVGQALERVAAVRELLHNPTTERGHAGSSAAPVEQRGAAAEGPSCAHEVDGETKERRIVYLADPFGRKANFNPYMRPCPGIRGGVVCELEEGHPGACCRGGDVWADDPTRRSVTPADSVHPTHRDEAAMNGAPGFCGQSKAANHGRRFA